MSDDPDVKHRYNEQVVYIIRHEHGYYKIGRSKKPLQRLDALQTGSPYELSILGVIKCNNAAETEKRLHEKYEDENKNGEWFRLNDSQLRHMMNLCDLDSGQVSRRYARSEEKRRELTLKHSALIG